MPKRLCAMLVVSAMAAFFTMPAFAAVEAADPAQLIQSISAEVTEIAKIRSSTDREGAMRKVVRQTFDLPYMAAATLGQHWTSANERQKARLLAAVESSEALAYSNRLGNFPGATMQIGKAIARAPGVWLVDSRLTLPNGQAMKLDWEVRQGALGMRVSDIKVAGVSMFAMRRADFEAYLQSHGGSVDSLIQVLEARVAR